MSAPTGPSLTLIACSVLEREVRALAQQHWPEASIVCLDSMLHMRPALLGERLEVEVRRQQAAGRSAVLVYGDCTASMAPMENLPGVARTRGVNCCSLLLGRATYRELLQAGVFFLLPEWVARWEEVFARELGLNRENAHALMQEMHRRLVYLDTGLVPIPTGVLNACAAFCGLPCEVRSTPLEFLHQAIEDARHRVFSSQLFSWSPP